MQRNSSRGDEFSAHVDKAQWGTCMEHGTTRQRSAGAMCVPKAAELCFELWDLGEWNRSDFGIVIVVISIQANVASYDWSALLYLSSAGKDFEGVGRTVSERVRGGELLFLDDDVDSQVEPKEGRLVFFRRWPWRLRSYGQKSWHSRKSYSEKPHETHRDKDSDHRVEDGDQNLPQRIEPREETEDARNHFAKDSGDSKVEGDDNKPEKDEAGFEPSLAGRYEGKLSGEKSAEKTSDHRSPQPDYTCDPAWFAWNAEMAWAFGAEGYEWQGGEFRPWRSWDKKSKASESPGTAETAGTGTAAGDTETMEKLASEWERPGWNMAGTFGKRHELVPKKANLKEQFEKAESEAVTKKTTLMLRNVPNAYDRETLMEELDHVGFSGCFNFLYLPIDSATKNNVGYAFVNFNDEQTADDCMNKMSGYFFKGQPYNRRRAAIVSVFFAPLPCQRPWVAPSAAQALLEKGCHWAPVGFSKLVEDAAVRPGTEQDDQSFSRRRMREQWWGGFPDGFDGFDFSYDMMNEMMMYGYFDYDGVPPGLLTGLGAQYHHPGQVLREEPASSAAEESKDSQNKEKKSGNLVDALSQMLRTGSQQVPVDDDDEEEDGELSMGDLKPMQSMGPMGMGWFGWEFFNGDGGSVATMNNPLSVPNYDDAQSTSLTDGCLVLLNVPLATTEWDLRQIIEHVGVHAPITVKFEPGASSDINQVTLHFRNKIDLEIAEVTLRDTSWSTEDGGARIQIYRSDSEGAAWTGCPTSVMPPWDPRSLNQPSWFSKDEGESEPSNFLAPAGNDSSPCPPERSFEQGTNGTEFEKDWPKLPAKAGTKIEEVQENQAPSCVPGQAPIFRAVFVPRLLRSAMRRGGAVQRSPTFFVGAEKQKKDLDAFQRREQQLAEVYYKNKPLCFNACTYQRTHPVKANSGHRDADATLVSPMAVGVADGVSQIEEYGIDSSELPTELLRQCEELAFDQLLPRSRAIDEVAAIANSVLPPANTQRPTQSSLLTHLSKRIVEAAHQKTKPTVGGFLPEAPSLGSLPNLQSLGLANPAWAAAFVQQPQVPARNMGGMPGGGTTPAGMPGYMDLPDNLRSLQGAPAGILMKFCFVLLVLYGSLLSPTVSHCRKPTVLSQGFQGINALGA
eukprot:Skav235222  [mRNA]  locus=scaffold3995:145551:167986:+ [translate_table: standard]